jgi:hypothetical protein
VVLHVALVAEPLGADVALYDECCLAPPVPRLVLDNVRGLREQKTIFLLIAMYLIIAVLWILIFKSQDPDSQSGSRRAKMTHKNRNNLINFFFEMLDIHF